MLAPLAEAAIAQTDGDPGRGLAASLKLCAGCHAVMPGVAVSPDRHAPAFEVAANYKGQSMIALAVWLQSSHPTMPLIKLSPGMASDISAYILTLKHRPKPD
jgi:mono/diheme cytochrome c family protein